MDAIFFRRERVRWAGPRGVMGVEACESKSVTDVASLSTSE